ncbi:MAG TPA: prephenate dehydratase [Chloroflexota bacterium]|nr:prephenate dehydratase [Chloroflexota bacterium]
MSAEGLSEARQAIDAIDRQLVQLLNERMRHVQRIGAVKAYSAQGVYAPAREEQVIANLLAANAGPLTERHLRAIWREIFAAARNLEEPQRVGYLGPAATFTHQAALERFGAATEYVPLPTIPDVFREAAQGHVHYGVVPVENSTEGSVHETLDAFAEFDLRVIAEIALGIHHQLVARVPRERIRRVFTNPVALGQCRRWLAANLPGVELVTVVSTARAAAQAAETPDSAAIAPRLAAEVYGLDIVAADIEDLAANYTRFYVLAPTNNNPPTGRDKTAILFSVRHEVGALSAVVQQFAAAGINLTSIQSRPLRGRPWEYIFFVEFEGHAAEPNWQRALTAVTPRCLFLKVLGSWPRAVVATAV